MTVFGRRGYFGDGGGWVLWLALECREEGVRGQRYRCPANTVILREVAVSMVECRGRWIFWGVRWQAEMDSATVRRMTKLGFYGHFGNDGVGVRRVLRG